MGAIYRRLKVYGADLNATPFGKLRISAEFAQSRWTNNAGVNAGPSVRDRQIIDARAGFRFGRLDILGFYKRLGVGFDAPGYWGTIGRWKNPRDLEGFGGILTLPLGGRTSIDLEGAKYRSLSGAFDLRHYRAGFRFALTSSNRVDLGYERAEYEPQPTGDKAAENYINIGWGHNFSPTTSFKLLYQIINFSVGDTGLNPLQSFNGAVAATQFTVRF